MKDMQSLKADVVQSVPAKPKPAVKRLSDPTVVHRPKRRPLAILPRSPPRTRQD